MGGESWPHKRTKFPETRQDTFPLPPPSGTKRDLTEMALGGLGQSSQGWMAGPARKGASDLPAGKSIKPIRGTAAGVPTHVPPKLPTGGKKSASVGHSQAEAEPAKDSTPARARAHARGQPISGPKTPRS